MNPISTNRKDPSRGGRQQQSQLIELSVKQEQDSTVTLSLVIRRVRYKKTGKNKYISNQGGMKLRKLSILVVN